jgi:hypothetical protein
MTAEPKFISRRFQAEELDERRPIFMSPKPVSPKRIPHESALGKRRFQDAFVIETFDDDRYGQHISSNFFEANIRPSVEANIRPSVEANVGDNYIQKEVKTFSYKEEQEILQWCECYLASKKLVNV